MRIKTVLMALLGSVIMTVAAGAATFDLTQLMLPKDCNTLVTVECEGSDGTTARLYVYQRELSTAYDAANGLKSAETEASSDIGTAPEASGVTIADTPQGPSMSVTSIPSCGGKNAVCADTDDCAPVQNGPWTLVLESEAIFGKNGLYKEKEGDGKTPVGVFQMNTPFGIGNALEGFPANYLKVTDSHYWSGDSESPYYNRLIDVREHPDALLKNAEHLGAYYGYYDYCLDMGCNAECTPYKGSALFLHCFGGDPNTHGCIGIPKDKMIEVMRLYREGQTWIAIGEKGVSYLPTAAAAQPETEHESNVIIFM